MTAEQKERMKYEVEVQKARELKRIADALEIISAKTARIKELEEKNKTLKDNFDEFKHDYDELLKQRNMLYHENKKLEKSNLDLGDTIGWYVEDFKKIKAENNNLLEAKKFAEETLKKIIDLIHGKE